MGMIGAVVGAVAGYLLGNAMTGSMLLGVVFVGIGAYVGFKYIPK